MYDDQMHATIALGIKRLLYDQWTAMLAPREYRTRADTPDVKL
jgi:hypothetical protein